MFYGFKHRRWTHTIDAGLIPTPLTFSRHDMAKLKSHVEVAAFPKGEGVLAVNVLELDLAWPAAIEMAGIRGRVSARRL